MVGNYIIEELPFNLKGDIFSNFFENNSELKNYPVIKELIEKETEENASKIMWSFYLYMDPRSFIFNKLTYNERINLIVRSYYEDFFPERHNDIREFYENRILINEDVNYHVKLKKSYESKVFSNNAFTIGKAVADLNGLVLYSQKCSGALNMGETYYNKIKNRYPKTIEGDMDTDDFFEANKELLLFEEMKELIESEGREEASKIMWSFFYVRDPKSFFYDQMNKAELEQRCKGGYHDIDFYKYIGIDDFYKNFILLDENKKDYKELKKKYDTLISIESKSYTVQSANQDRMHLLVLKQKIFSIKGKYKKTIVQGEKQPGLIAATVVE